jgi:hypothetical protein
MEEMLEQREKREQVTRNLLTEPRDTIRGMAEIEGPDWLEAQEAVNRETTSPGEYVTSLSNAIERAKVGDPATINGKSNNRWLVDVDGSVSFSETHAESAEHVAKARELGFAIGQ